MTTEFKYLDYEGLKLFKNLLEHLRLADKTDIVEVLNEISNGIHDGKLSLYINGVLLNEFTANQEGNTEANIIVPTELGDLNNSVEFIKNVIKYGQPDVSDLTDDQKESLHNQTSENSGLVSEDSLETTLASYGTAINYDTEHQKIQLLHNSTVLSEIDASDFIKDSMILNISVADGTGDNLGQKVLLIDFNTDSGINDIEIPISEFFNPDNYYVKDDFAAVATSGNYNDLSNIPSTLTQEEVNLGTNSDGKLVTAKIIRDSIDSAITGGNSKVITDDNLSEKVLAEGFAKSVLVGNNLPTIADVNGILFVPEQKQTDWNENNINDKAYIKNKPTVYNLSEIQNIVKYGQADVSELTDEEKTLIEQESGFVKNSDLPEYEISGSNYVWNFKKNNETISTITIPEPNEIPTDLSQFNNDVPFLVLSDIENLVESNNVYTKDEINNKIDLISNGSITLLNYYNKTLVNNILNDLPQPDWSLTDNTAKDYIKNKPTIYSQEEILNIIKYGLSDVSEMTDELKELAQNTSDYALKSDLFSKNYNDLTNKPDLFSGSWNDLTDKPTIPEGSVNVQSDWEEEDSESDSYIKNKPNIITELLVLDLFEGGLNPTDNPNIITSDNLELLVTDAGFIKSEDLPTIPDALIQSDWNQTDNSAKDYIKNKPNVYTQTEIENIIKYGQSDISELTPQEIENAQNNGDYVLKEDLDTNISNYFNNPSNKPSYGYSEINYRESSITSEGGQVSIDGSTNIFKITTSANISGITLTNVPENYHSCHIIIRNSSSDNDVIITISSTAIVTIDNIVYSFVCPKGDITLDIAKNSNDYVEFDILRIDNELYIRGV